MKFLEGKSPAERNKIIAAIVLGGLAVLAMGYTLSGFFFAPTTKASTSKTPTPTPTAGSTTTVQANNSFTDQIADPWMFTTPISYTPTAFSGDAGRNIFAFYEPPPPTPWSPTPVIVKPPPTPIPTPPPPYTLAYVTPSSVYAGSKGFRMEIVGANFTSDARIIFNGNEIATNFISDQKLTADISANLISMQGSPQVMVRNPDGTKYSLPMMVQIQAPPTPNFEYVGLIEKKHRNNDMAMLREKSAKTDNSYRLNDNVGDRFRLVSISGREVVLEDRSLGFKHRIQFSETKGAGSGGAGGFGPNTLVNQPGGRNGGRQTGLQDMYNPTIPGGISPAMPSAIPGIPDNIQRVPLPNTNAQPRPANNPKKDYEDDNDGPNR